MKINCDKVLTVDNFDDAYSSWEGRVLTIMDDYIKVSQNGIPARYFDTIYLFENAGVLIGFKYGSPLNECYISTKDGQESECYVDAEPYLFKDSSHMYAVVKRSYRNVDLKRIVIGLGIIDIATLNSLDTKYTWPMWECIESIHNGAIVIKKGENSYGMSTIDKFPRCNLVNYAMSVEEIEGEENIYVVTKYNGRFTETIRCNFSKQLSKIKMIK